MQIRNSPDISGLQPSGSIIIPDTQAGGLGFLIVRRWRSRKVGEWCPLAREIGQHPSATVCPPANRSTPNHHRLPHPPQSAPSAEKPSPERHGVSSHFFCRLKKVTALTPGAGNRSTPIRNGFRHLHHPRTPPQFLIPPPPSPIRVHRVFRGYNPPNKKGRKQLSPLPAQVFLFNCQPPS